MALDAAYVIGGAVVGFIVGATGVGGGSLMTPLLTLVFNVPAHMAVGTDLLFAAITKSSGVVAHSRAKTVHWGITAWQVAGSVTAAIITLSLVHWLQPDATALARVMTRTLGVALVLTAGALLFKAEIQKLGRRFSAARTAASEHFDTIPETVPRVIPTVIVGLIIGTLVSLTSVGAGVLGVVALFFLYPNLAPARIVGTDIAHAVPLTLVAGLGHATLGAVNWSLLGALLVGSLPAIYLGSMLAARMHERLLRSFLAVMLVGIGSKLLLT
jgi:uncharacterized membrane protein YfcA